MRNAMTFFDGEILVYPNVKVSNLKRTHFADSAPLHVGNFLNTRSKLHQFTIKVGIKVFVQQLTHSRTRNPYGIDDNDERCEQRCVIIRDLEAWTSDEPD